MTVRGTVRAAEDRTAEKRRNLLAFSDAAVRPNHLTPTIKKRVQKHSLFYDCGGTRTRPCRFRTLGTKGEQAKTPQRGVFTKRYPTKQGEMKQGYALRTFRLCDWGGQRKFKSHRQRRRVVTSDQKKQNRPCVYITPILNSVEYLFLNLTFL